LDLSAGVGSWVFGGSPASSDVSDVSGGPVCAAAEGTTGERNASANVVAQIEEHVRIEFSSPSDGTRR